MTANEGPSEIKANKNKDLRISMITTIDDSIEETCWNSNLESAEVTRNLTVEVNKAISRYIHGGLPTTISILVGTADIEKVKTVSIAEPTQPRFMLTDKTTVSQLKQAIRDLLTEHKVIGFISNFSTDKEWISQPDAKIPNPRHFACYVLPGSNERFYIIINSIDDRSGHASKLSGYWPLYSLRVNSDDFQIAHKICGMISKFFLEWC